MLDYNIQYTRECWYYILVLYTYEWPLSLKLSSEGAEGNK